MIHSICCHGHGDALSTVGIPALSVIRRGPSGSIDGYKILLGTALIHTDSRYEI
jgi:hypothetical protein